VSTTRLLILGLVRWLQPVHGYDVRRELLSWEVEEWANVQPGSIYHALRKLTDEGLLAEVATEQVGARPARTTYRVTDEGEREYAELLRGHWWHYRQAIDPFAAAFAFLPALPRSEAVAALRGRAKTLEEQLARFTSALGPDGIEEMAGKPVHVAWMFELSAARTEAEIGWCRRVADRVEAGEGHHDSEIDRDEMARRWRQEIAAEFHGEADSQA
jgi:DNA-binding PadR family transcriptional regulator